MTQFDIVPEGPFSLAATIRFLEGFTPAAYLAGKDGGEGLRLAFCTEGTWQPVGVSVTQGDEVVSGEIHDGSAPVEDVRAQVARILSLDIDGRGFAEVGNRDPVVKHLQSRYAGLRPVCFWSAYEATAWGLLSQRVRMTQAANLKKRMAEELGHPVTVAGERLYAFPEPARLARLDDFQGLFGRKAEYLRALGEAALEGRLGAARLRSLDPDEALAELEQLPGVGPFSAQLILVRGAGHPDLFPKEEKRLLAAMKAAYGLTGGEEMARIAEKWRPYRSWVSLLLRADMTQGAGR